jgi:hypothetical protein
MNGFTRWEQRAKHGINLAPTAERLKTLGKKQDHRRLFDEKNDEIPTKILYFFSYVVKC